VLPGARQHIKDHPETERVFCRKEHAGDPLVFRDGVREKNDARLRLWSTQQKVPDRDSAVRIGWGRIAPPELLIPRLKTRGVKEQTVQIAVRPPELIAGYLEHVEESATFWR